MKILFIENKYKTYFWEEIARQLSKNHDIYWLVQNHNFIPRAGKIFVIPYPKNKAIYSPPPEELAHILAADRNLNYFGCKNPNYFSYYNQKIGAIIKSIKPDFVFGETTLYHELLASHYCQKNNIKYLHPSSCRYPAGRFSFYRYNTLAPYKGSQEILQDNIAQKIAQDINNRDLLPDYMKSNQINLKKKIINKLKDITLMSKSYFSGEKYNTPSPFKKITIEYKKKTVITNWNCLAENAEANKHKKENFNILYPLQMQPEANIDIWGNKYRNQTEVIKNIVDNTDEDISLFIKPNPKSKYEMTKELVELIKNNDRIIPISTLATMNQILPDMDLIVTVTGTIAIEAILSNKPVVTLIKTINNNSKNCIYLQEYNGIELIIDMIKNNKFPQCNLTEKISFINILNQTSYQGLISDPFSYPSVLNKENINNITDAFNNILK